MTDPVISQNSKVVLINANQAQPNTCFQSTTSRKTERDRERTQFVDFCGSWSQASNYEHQYSLRFVLTLYRHLLGLFSSFFFETKININDSTNKTTLATICADTITDFGPLLVFSPILNGFLHFWKINHIFELAQLQRSLLRNFQFFVYFLAGQIAKIQN